MAGASRAIGAGLAAQAFGPSGDCRLLGPGRPEPVRAPLPPGPRREPKRNRTGAQPPIPAARGRRSMSFEPPPSIRRSAPRPSGWTRSPVGELCRTSPSVSVPAPGSRTGSQPRTPAGSRPGSSWAVMASPTAVARSRSAPGLGDADARTGRSRRLHGLSSPPSSAGGRPSARTAPIAGTERDASLVMDALTMAVRRRGKADARLHHSDQGGP